jgi:cyclic pyranopterin phosphate synthase
MNTESNRKLVDKFGRQVTYVRLSVTDRCDFRCVYCMAEEMTFLPKDHVLSLEQLEQIARAFVNLGVKKIRLTGGEPLTRHNSIKLIENVGQLEGLEDFTLTTNGAQLTKYASQLRDAGMTRINISLDSLKPDRFKELTRTGKLEKVLAGIDAAIAAGFERIKLNAVVLTGRNDDEIIDLVEYARDKGVDISFIEEMPLGLIEEHSRAESYLSSDEIRNHIHAVYPLAATDETTGGPSKYYRMPGCETRVGFISPHSHNFCHLCNRVRVTVDGRLLLCLGNEHSVDLKAVMDEYPNDQDMLERTIIEAMDLKPEKHHFNLEEEPQIVRFMNMTGG